ncbi:MAG: ATP-binding protein [Pseudomonadota bacterium]
MRFHLHSLRVKIMLASTLVELLMLGYLMLNTMRLIDQSTQVSTEAALKQTVPMLNVVTAPYLVQGDYATLQDNLNEILGDTAQGVTYVVVRDSAGRVVAKAGIADPATLPPPSGELMPALRAGLVHVQRPLSLAGQQVGTLRFGLSTHLVVLARQAVLRQSGLIAVAEIVLTFILLGVLGYWLTRNLHAFAASSRSIADGRYHLRLPERGRDEVGTLARNFNRMSEAVERTVGALRASEQRYRELNEQLEARVEQRSRELRDAIDQLAETEKLASLGRVVAGVAHELNTPIGNVVLMSSTMVDKLAALTAALQARAMTRAALHTELDDLASQLALVQRNAQRAGQLIEGFRRVAVDQTSQRRRPFELGTVLADVLDMMGAQLRRAGVTATLAVPDGIAMDSIPGHLEQIFTNLIANSLLHGYPDGGGGHITVTAREQGAWVEIVYRDDGCGIAPGSGHKIFEPFFTSRLGQGGSGLGLFIVHNLVYGALAGRLKLESGAGQGVCFTFHLPRVTPGQEVQAGRALV